MAETFHPPRRTWRRKFHDAARGLLVACRGQSSFAFHFAAAVGVVSLAAWCDVSRHEWCILILCIAVVMAAELVNTALELIAKAMTNEFRPQLRDALDVGGGAVLAAALGAAITGGVVLLPYLLRLLSRAD